MLRINYAESSLVIRGMSEAASCTQKNSKQNHKNRCKTNEDTSPAPVGRPFVTSSHPSLRATLTCVAIDAEAIAEAEQRKPLSPPSLPSLGT